jgi:hypothetical protein
MIIPSLGRFPTSNAARSSILSASHHGASAHSFVHEHPGYLRLTLTEHIQGRGSAGGLTFHPRMMQSTRPPSVRIPQERSSKSNSMAHGIEAGNPVQTQSCTQPEREPEPIARRKLTTCRNRVILLLHAAMAPSDPSHGL